MWSTLQLHEVAIVIAGQSPKGENYNKKGKGLPFYQGKKDYGKKSLNPPTVWTTEVTKKAQAGDILMSVRAPVGALNYSSEEICIGRGIAAIRPKENVVPDYLFYSLFNISDSLTGSAGAIFNSINKRQIEVIQLVLPPLAEQQRIVAKLDAVFAEIDVAVAAVKRKQEQVDSLKNALLSSELRPAAIDAVKWKTAKLGDVSKIQNGGTPNSKIKKYWDGHILWLTPKDMGRLASRYVSSTERKITQQGLSNSSAKLAPGYSVIFSCRAPIGHVAINTDEMSFNQGCKSLTPSSELDTAFLYYFLLASRKYLNELGSGTTFKELSTKKLADVQLPFPSLAEQQRIVAKLDAVFEQADVVKDIMSKQLANYQALKSALLTDELTGKAA